MVDRVQRLQHLFVVRIWQEPSSSAPPGQWRGSAEHVPTGQRFYFANIEELNRCILGQMNKAAVGLFAQPLNAVKAEDERAPDPKEAAPTLLSERQVALLQESFRQATRSTESLAQHFYRRLCEIEPSIGAIFPADLAEQEQAFVTLLAVLIGEMGNTDKLRALLSDLLSDDVAPDVEEAWNAAYRMIAGVMKKV